MSELVRELEAARGRIEIDWSPDRARRVERSMFRRKRRRTAIRAGTSLVAVAAVAAALAVQLSPGRTPGASALALQLGEGAQAERLSPAGELSVQTASSKLLAVAISKGAFRFQIEHRPDRVFRVEVGDVTIEDVGTRFTVEPLEDRVKISVQEGEVRVRSVKGESSLTAPQSVEVPRSPVEDAAVLAAPVDDGAPSAIVRHRPRPKHHRPTSGASWKALAEDGEYDAAYDVLSQAGTASVRDETEELLLAVDVARLSRHPAEAVAPLHRILANHRSDPRAPLAAFTLGRVLLEELGSPRDAAAAFAQVRGLEPSGPLAEDALAREVESWSRAGERERARAKAEEYLAKYPDGRRARSVSRFGHVE